MTIGPLTSLREIAFVVGTALDNAGITAVLSGGGAATVYAPDVNESRDLDFVLGFWSSMGEPDHSVRALGFEPVAGHYRHGSSAFTLEFLQGPLMIGSEPITAWDTLHQNGFVLNILTPTDCVRDRPFGSSSTKILTSML